MDSPLKKRDVTLGSLAFLVVQFLSNLNSSNNVIQEIKTQMERDRIERERFFVRKDDLRQIEGKIDRVNGELHELKASFLKKGSRYVD